MAVASNMHFKGKPETLGPLALFPLAAQAPPGLPELRGSGGGKGRVGKVTRFPQSLPQTRVGNLPSIPSPATGSAPQLEGPATALGKGAAVAAADRSAAKLLTPPSTPSLCSHPAPHLPFPPRFARMSRRRKVLRNEPSVKQVAFVCRLPAALLLGSQPGALQHFGGLKLGYHIL